MDKPICNFCTIIIIINEHLLDANFVVGTVRHTCDFIYYAIILLEKYYYYQICFTFEEP